MDRAYDELVRMLAAEGYLKTPAYLEAFRAVPRADFLPDGMQLEAGINAPLPIGEQQTISQPLTVAFMLELLAPVRGNKVLDVGTGSGWTAALLANVVGKSGQVFGIERMASLCAFGRRNLAKYHFPNVTITCGDGSLGLPEHAPFDRVEVAAAAKEIPPPLLEQLAVGGRMVIPTQADDLRLVERVSEKKYRTKIYPGFLFVPLIEEREAGSRKQGGTGRKK